MYVPMNIIILLAIMVGIIWLQIFLSSTDNRWCGLLLPVICLLFSFIPVLSVPYSASNGEVMTQELSSDGTVIKETITQVGDVEKRSIGETILTIGTIFLISNVPTLVLTGVYFACREKVNRNVTN